MLNKILRVIFILFCALGIGYLILPNYNFPDPPPDSLQSQEPADTESLFRRAYFTNYTRAEVIEWYKNQFKTSSFYSIKMPTLLLNYPPEDSATIIRDQTMSTYLQEVVHPFREGFYINGFEPTQEKDAIFIDGRSWKQKIIIRFVPSTPWIRVGIFSVTAILMMVLWRGLSEALIYKKHE